MWFHKRRNSWSQTWCRHKPRYTPPGLWDNSPHTCRWSKPGPSCTRYHKHRSFQDQHSDSHRYPNNPFDRKDTHNSQRNKASHRNNACHRLHSCCCRFGYRYRLRCTLSGCQDNSRHTCHWNKLRPICRRLYKRHSLHGRWQYRHKGFHI